VLEKQALRCENTPQNQKKYGLDARNDEKVPKPPDFVKSALLAKLPTRKIGLEPPLTQFLAETTL
jgi:hypothetical protein